MELNWVGIGATVILVIGIFIALVIIDGKARVKQRESDKQRDEALAKALATTIAEVTAKLMINQTEAIHRMLQQKDGLNGDKTTDTESEG